MAKKTLCDGSTVEWEPRIERVQGYCECPLCNGEHNDYTHDAAEPSSHGEVVWTDHGYRCSRCNAFMAMTGLPTGQPKNEVLS